MLQSRHDGTGVLEDCGVAGKKKMSHDEVEALRQEVKNLASQVNTAVERIHELESEKHEEPGKKPSDRELTLQEEVHALRQEIGNLASALTTAVGRIRELEEGR
jgi:predicted RNase H-like nuclease (RuvC/YqgF family)